MLPEEVLEEAQKKLLDYEGSGMSVMEMSHRGKHYEAINAEAEALLREIMNIPDSYEVIFVQGGATTQFEAVPLNLAKHGAGDYVVTGNFAERAYKEAVKFGNYKEAASSADKKHTYIPSLPASTFRKNIDYVHICYNNTIFGTKYDKVPDTDGIPIVADMSSCILSEEFDVSKFGVIYAGAQKNAGPAGVTIVIVRKDLIGNESKHCPAMLKWSTQIKEKSLYNTPPCFSTYMCMLVFRWIKKNGGVKAVHEVNKKKAKLLYDMIDKSKFYSNKVEKFYRSIMNVPFTTPSAELDENFIKAASAEGLTALKGHRLVGGMRASIYNAMPTHGVEKLVEFMKKFEKANK